MLPLSWICKPISQGCLISPGFCRICPVFKMKVLVHMPWNNVLESSCYDQRCNRNLRHWELMKYRGRWLLPCRWLWMALSNWLVIIWILPDLWFVFYFIQFLIAFFWLLCVAFICKCCFSINTHMDILFIFNTMKSFQLFGSALNPLADGQLWSCLWASEALNS